jgi:hypothetical protein
LRRDNAFAASALASKQSDFKVLVMESGDGFSESVKTTLARFAPNVPVTVSSEKPQGEFSALVMSGSFAAGGAPEWIRSFRGSRIIVPNEASGIIWAGGVNKRAIQQAAQAIRQLAEGQEVRQSSAANSAWMILIYIAAALFGMQLLFVLLALLISTFAN